MKKVIGINQLKEIQLEMMAEFAEYCKKKDLRYYLAYGTLIGAIRHEGYIPWDDDVDLMIFRKDYEKLIADFNHDNPDSDLKVICQKNDSGYYLPFAKLVNTKTVLKENVNSDYELGIYIDLFPIENLSDDYEHSIKLIQKAFNYNRIMQLKIINWSNSRSLVKNMILGLGKCAFIFCSISKILEIFERFREKECNQVESKYVGVMAGISAGNETRVYERAWFKEYEYKKFENALYPVPIGYDAILRTVYGDYMKLPPEEQRVSHHSFEAWYK